MVSHPSLTHRDKPARYITAEGLRASSAVLLPAESVLLSSRAPIGLLAINQQPVTTNQGFKSLVPDRTRLDCRYLVEALKFRLPNLLNQGNGATFKEVSKATVERFEIPVPQLEEQRRIINALRYSSRKINQYREYITNSAAIQDSIVESFFARRLEWSTRLLGEISEVRGGLSVTTKRTVNTIELPYLRVANVLRGRLELSEIKTILVTEREARDKTLKAGDVLIVEGHGNPDELGRCTVWDGSIRQVTHQNHIIRARPEIDLIRPSYASSWINSRAGRAAMQNFVKTTSGLNTLNISNIRSIAMPVAPMEQQMMLESQLADLGKLHVRYNQGLCLAQELHDSFQYRAFRGEL